MRGRQIRTVDSETTIPSRLFQEAACGKQLEPLATKEANEIQLQSSLSMGKPSDVYTCLQLCELKGPTARIKKYSDQDPEICTSRIYVRAEI